MVPLLVRSTKRVYGVRVHCIRIFEVFSTRSQRKGNVRHAAAPDPVRVIIAVPEWDANGSAVSDTGKATVFEVLNRHITTARKKL